MAKTKCGPATAALRAFIDGELEHGWRALGIPSRAAFKREYWRYEDVYDFGGDYAAPALYKRVAALEVMDGLDGDGVDTDRETLDEWALEIRNKWLPGALKRPATKVELKKLRGAMDAADRARRVKSEASYARYRAHLESQRFAEAITGEHADKAVA